MSTKAEVRVAILAISDFDQQVGSLEFLTRASLAARLLMRCGMAPCYDAVYSALNLHLNEGSMPLVRCCIFRNNKVFTIFGGLPGDPRISGSTSPSGQ